MTDNIIWFNGETSWSYLPAEKEVTIAKRIKKIIPFNQSHLLFFRYIKKATKQGFLKKMPVHI